MMTATVGGASPASSPPGSPDLDAKRRGREEAMSTTTGADVGDVVRRSKKEKAEEEEEEPEHLMCPISRCMFRDPVFVPGSGNT